jgi:hypothetical protein
MERTLVCNFCEEGLPMLFNCVNPDCGADFLYLYEGELIVIELPDRTVRRYWLCGACAPYMRVVYDPCEGVKLVAKDVPLNKPADSETLCEAANYAVVSSTASAETYRLKR